MLMVRFLFFDSYYVYKKESTCVNSILASNLLFLLFHSSLSLSKSYPPHIIITMAIHTLFVRNMSGHDQRFQVHGWNGNKDIVVKAHGETKIQAADGSSGAIIAVHDGHIGEQAEITKHGYMGNDFIDMSNICGAGGNMIVQQVGDAKTRKGDPKFMQNLNNAWKKASQQTKDGLKNCVHVKDGKVIRIDAIKDFPKLEAFVRTFADGKTYIGVGAWNGSPGNANDNNQVSFHILLYSISTQANLRIFPL